MNRRPPRRPQMGRPYHPGHMYHRYHYYPWWYWNHDYDYDWGYDDDFDLHDYYYLDQLESSRDEFAKGFKAGLKAARKEKSQHESATDMPEAGYCGSMGA